MIQEVFIAVVGTSPQVVTEALYYFYSDFYHDQRKFNRIRLITTTAGRNLLIQTLFRGEKLKALEKALHLEQGTIPLTPNDIILLTDKMGNPINDLRTTESNLDSIGKLFDEVYRWTSMPDTRITAQVSGGRKTMSAFMALALQLYGREQDDMIHILVPDDKMRPGSDWFFPEDPSRDDEKMELSYVPVLKVGRYLKTELNTHPEKLVHKLQTVIRERFNLEKLIVNGKEIICDHYKLSFSPKKAAVFRLLLRKKMNAACEESCMGCEHCSYSPLELLQAYENGDLYKEYIQVANPYGSRAEALKNMKKLSVEIGNIHTDISRIRSDIENSQIPDEMQKALTPEIREIPHENTRRYTLNLNKKIIRFVKED